ISEVVTLEDLALPKTLRITYQDINRSLNPSTAIFTREITQSTTIEEFSVQAVDSSDAMRNSVFTGMSILMSSKRTFKLSVPLKYSVLEPGDVIIVPVSDNNTAKVRIQQATLGANNIVDLECALYIDTLSGVGVTGFGVSHTNKFPTGTNVDDAAGVPVTILWVLDLPYLTDSAELNSADEEDSGVYVAFSSTSTRWPGVNLYVDQSTVTTEDNFGTIAQVGGAPDWQSIATSGTPVAAGLIARLPDLDASSLVQDTASELIVAFYTPYAEFETISAASIENASQDNVFLVGNEIIQAQTVELLDSTDGFNTYLFTDLYRGLQGTEWAIGTQDVFESPGGDVVHLDAGGLQRVDLGNPDLSRLTFNPGDPDVIGPTVDYRASTVGSDITSTETTSAVFKGYSRAPYAPRVESVVIDSEGNLTFDLIQRNRYGNEWTSAIPPFESDPDDFEVDILDGSLAIRTIAVSGTATISYTAAQQVTDFGVVQEVIVARAYQLSAGGYRGFSLRWAFGASIGGVLAGTPPDTLFALGEVGSYYDIGDITTLWTDVAGTAQVSADGDLVARIDDKSGNGYHLLQSTSALRPIYRDGGFLEFEGTQYIATAADKTWTQPSLICMGLAKQAQGSDGFGGVILDATTRHNFSDTPTNQRLYTNAQAAGVQSFQTVPTNGFPDNVFKAVASYSEAAAPVRIFSSNAQYVGDDVGWNGETILLAALGFAGNTPTTPLPASTFVHFLLTRKGVASDSEILELTQWVEDNKPAIIPSLPGAGGSPGVGGGGAFSNPGDWVRSNITGLTRRDGDSGTVSRINLDNTGGTYVANATITRVTKKYGYKMNVPGTYV
ncbi:MAG TPA: phage tail protein, partial [Hyphomicrobiaceae bacterium]|nr:phage tail protein [Hyphomicrobiaceae bacterium]